MKGSGLRGVGSVSLAPTPTDASTYRIGPSAARTRPSAGKSHSARFDVSTCASKSVNAANAPCSADRMDSPRSRGDVGASRGDGGPLKGHVRVGEAEDHASCDETELQEKLASLCRRNLASGDNRPVKMRSRIKVEWAPPDSQFLMSTWRGKTLHRPSRHRLARVVLRCTFIARPKRSERYCISSHNQHGVQGDQVQAEITMTCSSANGQCRGSGDHRQDTNDGPARDG